MTVKQLIQGMLVLLVILGLAACGGGKKHDVTSSQKPAKKTALVPPATKGTAEQLAGTVWKGGGYILTFETPPVVKITGKKVPIKIGVKGKYTVTDGIITVNAVGRTKKGTWDGTTLVFDGLAMQCVKKPENATVSPGDAEKKQVSQEKQSAQPETKPAGDSGNR